MRQAKALIVLLVMAMLAGCATQSAPPPFEPDVEAPPTFFEPEFQQLKIKPGYVQKVENFLVILDDSSSMFGDNRHWPVLGQTKIVTAKETILNMNTVIPDLKLQSGLRIFGPIVGTGKKATDTQLVAGMSAYDRAEFAAAVRGVGEARDLTPLSHPLAASAKDLQDLSGRSAIILVSDGMNTKADSPVAQVMKLKEQFGDRLCIYTIKIGDDPAGTKLLEDIATAGTCGYAIDADILASGQRMDEFVERVFLEKGMMPKKVERLDSDGDGVYDDSDLCPDTPRGVAVDENGCPKDSDGDGVPDYKDRCPGTMRGMKVDEHGCPPPVVSIRLQVEFDFNKTVVKPAFKQQLKDFAAFMKSNPQATAVLEGHTDNVGSESYNLDLSNRRAESVKRFLIDELGVKADRMETKGYGFAKPVASNDTEAGRQQNRRVVAVIKTGSAM